MSRLTFVFVSLPVCGVFQEERAAFDIHDYGDRIVGALNGVGHRRSFASIVAGLDNFEACKYLLASLQLVNHTEIFTAPESIQNNVNLMSFSRM